MDGEGRPSTSKTTRLTIPTKNVLDVQVHFSRSLSVIFIRAIPSISRQVSKELGLSKNGSAPYWDTVSDEESEKRLTLLPNQLVEAEKNAIKQAFVHSAIYKEISSAEANDILLKCSPKGIHDGIPTEVALSNNAIKKENGHRVEVHFNFITLKKHYLFASNCL